MADSAIVECHFAGIIWLQGDLFLDGTEAELLVGIPAPVEFVVLIVQVKVLSETRMVLDPQMMQHGRTHRGAAPSVPRSHGVHVGAVNRSLGIAAGKLSDPEDVDFPFDRFTESEYPLLPALGVSWEEFRASHYGHGELIWQP